MMDLLKTFVKPEQRSIFYFFSFIFWFIINIGDRMKKIILLLVVSLLLIGCGKEADLIGTWNSNNQSTYTFNEDGTCQKIDNVDIYQCTYEKENGVVNIYLKNKPNEVYESGQINSDRIIIGSTVYKKGE